VSDLIAAAATATDDMNDERYILVVAGEGGDGDGVSLHLSPASASASTFSIYFRFSDHRQVDYGCGVEIMLME
jgi:hypothetical protein